MTEERRLRDNVATVRKALAEMKHLRILASVQPFTEKLVYVPTKRRPKVVGAVWTLYPSSEFVEEVISGNKEMATARSGIGGNKGESALLPGFQEHPAQ